MLKYVLMANAMSCALFGALFVFAAPTTASWVGSPPVLVLQLLGAALLINAALLIWVSLQQQPNHLAVLFFSLGDAVWVVSTLVLLVTGVWITTTWGVVWSLAVAAFVGTCGLLQWKLVPRE